VLSPGCPTPCLSNTSYALTCCSPLSANWSSVASHYLSEVHIPLWGTFCRYLSTSHGWHSQSLTPTLQGFLLVSLFFW
jgi:hypothetical protein